MIKHIPFASLGHQPHGWLDARHHFSFAAYHNPQRMQFGTLRVINDDTIAAGTGFGMHGHQNMEIITYVRQGAITHRDNLGNEGRTGAGDVQVMSAGTGIMHSEHNREHEATRLYQIWITPNDTGVKPRWDAAAFPKAPVKDTLHLLVSGRPEDEGKGALFIHQDAALYGGHLAPGSRITQPLKHQGYLLVSEGSVTLEDGQEIKAGDGAEITGAPSVTLSSATGAEVLVIDAPTA
jgi:hypothetical protein